MVSTLKKDPSPGGPTTDGSTIYTDQHNAIVDRLGGETALTGNRVLNTNASGDIEVSSVTKTTLGYLDATSSIQTQIDAKQASDTDLTAIAGLSPSNDDIIQRKAGAWTNRTMTQLKSDLAIVEADISDLQAYLLNITGEPLSDLSDVTITAIASGEILKWNGSAWINNTLAEAGISATGHTHTESDITDLQSYLLNITNEPLSDLSDVVISGTPADNEVLAYNTGTSKWINQTASEAGLSAAGHTHTESDITDLQSYALTTRKLDDFGTPDDNTDLDATTLRHGLLPKLGGGTTNFLRADGTWSAPAGGGDALTSNPLSQFAATTSAQLAGVISDETGTGALVFATSPTLVTPALGTPASGVLTNCTGLPTAGLVDEAVTYAKMQHVSATDRFLGRDTAGAGDVEEITMAAARTMLNVEDGADVTDTTNVNAAGATMNTDATLVGNSYFLDEDNMISNDATKVPSQQSVKAYADTKASSSHTHTESDITDLQSYLLNIVEDTTPQLGGALDGQGNNLNNMGVVFMTEQAAAEADVVGKLQMWTKTATPNQLWYTDDAGTDFRVASLAGTETLTNKTIDGDNNTISNLAIGAEVGTTLTETQEIWIPAGAFTSSTTNGAEISSRETTTNKVNYTYAGFDTTTSESAWFTWTPPANWNAGTVKFTLYWTNTGGSATQTIDFDLAAVAFANDNPLDTAVGTAQNVTDTFLAQNDLHVTSKSAAITIAGSPAAGEEVHFKLSRDVASDNMSGDADVIGVLLEYTINDIGTT